MGQGGEDGRRRTIDIFVAYVFQTQAYYLSCCCHNIGLINIAAKGVPRAPTQSWEFTLLLLSIAVSIMKGGNIPLHRSVPKPEQRAQQSISGWLRRTYCNSKTACSKLKFSTVLQDSIRIRPGKKPPYICIMPRLPRVFLCKLSRSYL
jgi:hypothetical protein